MITRVLCLCQLTSRTLDIISLATLELVNSIDLETPEPRPASDTASKAAIRLSAFWHWSRLQMTLYKDVRSPGACPDLADIQQEPLLIVSGLPWPCALPSPNGEVTRVIMLRQVQRGGFSIVSRLELPAQGDVAVRSSGAGMSSFDIADGQKHISCTRHQVV